MLQKHKQAAETQRNLKGVTLLLLHQFQFAGTTSWFVPTFHRVHSSSVSDAASECVTDNRVTLSLARKQRANSREASRLGHAIAAKVHDKRTVS